MNRNDQNAILTRTEQATNMIVSQFNHGCDNVHHAARMAARSYHSSLLLKIPSWIDGITCSNTVDNIFKVKRQAKAYTEEVVSELKQRIKADATEWAESRFVPLLENELNTLANTVNADTEKCYEELGKLRVDLDVNQREIVDNATPSGANRLISTGTSLLIGDLGGAIMGGAGGFEGMLKTLTCEFVGGFVLGIIALFTPIGLPALIITAIIGMIAGGCWTLSSIEKKIRRKVKEAVLDSMKSKEHLLAYDNMIHGKVEQYLSILRDEMEENVNKLQLTADAYSQVLAN